MTVSESPVEIHLSKIQSPLDYATCLHELGHVAGRYQNCRYSRTREHWALAVCAPARISLDRGNADRPRRETALHEAR
jgi:hypothetical protein